MVARGQPGVGWAHGGEVCTHAYLSHWYAIVDNLLLPACGRNDVLKKLALMCSWQSDIFSGKQSTEHSAELPMLNRLMSSLWLWLPKLELKLIPAASKKRTLQPVDCDVSASYTKHCS